MAQRVKNLPAMWETWVHSLGWEDPLEKGEATHSVFWPGEFHGLHSPWGRKESDTAEQLSHFGTKVLRVQEQWLITITEHTCLYLGNVEMVRSSHMDA